MKTLLNQKNLIKLALDATIFTGFLIAMEPRFTGIAIHEWLTIAGTAAFITHLLLNWDWIVQITRRFFRKVSGQARINYVLNWVLFVDMVLIMLTGLMISEVALPMLGIQLPMGFAWRRLHSLTADLFIPILGLHVALHWRWIVSTTKRLILGILPVRRTHQAAESQEVQA
jgi:cytochrome b